MHVYMCLTSYMQEAHIYTRYGGLKSCRISSSFFSILCIDIWACLSAGMDSHAALAFHVSTSCTWRLQTGHHMYFEGGESENWISNPHIWATSTIPSETFLQPFGFIFNCTLYLFEIYCDIIYEVINFLSLKLPSHQHLLNNPSSLQWFKVLTLLYSLFPF